MLAKVIINEKGDWLLIKDCIFNPAEEIKYIIKIKHTIEGVIVTSNYGAPIGHSVTEVPFLQATLYKDMKAFLSKKLKCP